MPARIYPDRPLTNRERYLRYKARFPERINEQKRRWERENPDKAKLIRQRAAAKTYLNTIRPKRIVEMYGITVEDYDRLFDEQDGVCAICHQPETAKTKSGNARILSVDHDHETGEVRGLLCGRCNTAIGMLQDDPNILLGAVDYLLKDRIVGEDR